MHRTGGPRAKEHVFEDVPVPPQTAEASQQLELVEGGDEAMRDAHDQPDDCADDIVPASQIKNIAPAAADLDPEDGPEVEQEEAEAEETIGDEPLPDVSPEKDKLVSKNSCRVKT